MKYREEKSKDEVLNINPEYAEAWFTKGSVLGKQNRYEEAIKAYNEVLKIDPQYAEALFDKGYRFKSC